MTAVRLLAAYLPGLIGRQYIHGEAIVTIGNVQVHRQAHRRSGRAHPQLTVRLTLHFFELGQKYERGGRYYFTTDKTYQRVLRVRDSRDCPGLADVPAGVLKLVGAAHGRAVILRPSVLAPDLRRYVTQAI